MGRACTTAIKHKGTDKIWGILCMSCLRCPSEQQEHVSSGKLETSLAGLNNEKQDNTR